MDTQFIAKLREICSGEFPAAIVTIIDVKGSAPRKPGAKMLILPDGQVFGTIGGGCGEAEVKSQALMALDSLTPKTYTVNMTNDMAEEEGMVCGGVMQVFIDILGPGINEDKRMMNEYVTALENNEKPFLVSVIDSQQGHPGLNMGKKLFLTSAGNLAGIRKTAESKYTIEDIKNLYATQQKPGLVTLSPVQGQPAIRVFVEPAASTLKLVILGGGHIALPLAAMAKTVGFRVTVVDDRPAFANEIRFSSADKVICDDFSHALQNMSITPDTFVVIVTRGHRHDKQCLTEVIDSPAFYIGMIGSRRRVKALMSELHQQGVPLEKLQRVYSPIGLDINAETPEEISVSILAELIKVYRDGDAPSRKISF